MDATHIVVSFPSQDSEQMYRAADGMFIGTRKDKLVVWGEDGNKRQGRMFLTADHAKTFLRDQVPFRVDELPKDKAILEDLAGEGMIVMPEGAQSFDSFTALNGARKVF